MSRSDELVTLARRRYRFGQSDGGIGFAVPADGPPLAHEFRGSTMSLRSELAAMYHGEYGRVPGSSTVADAMSVLEGQAQAQEPEPLHTRVAERDGVWLDLGHKEGRFVQVTETGWSMKTSPPMLFRHTALTGPLPEPEAGGDFEELREYLNLDDEQWLLVRGWVVALLFPTRPQPILCLVGRQGAGKSTIARTLVNLVDPSPAPLRSPPREPTDWAVSAAASYVVALDNCSRVPDWLSDALCRAVTGDGWLRRALYTDDRVAICAFRRAIIINGIALGALRGDLLDRAILLEPHPINPERRRLESDMTARWQAARGRILGGLLDLASRTFAHLPAVRLLSQPRMADHAQILAALDQATGTAGLAAYLQASGRALEAAIDECPVAFAVRRLMETHDEWGPGLASDLLPVLKTQDPWREWPTTPQHLSEQLRRAAPLLEATGIHIEQGLSHGSGQRGIRLTKAPR